MVPEDDKPAAGPAEDKTVKELLDAATQADLARWFGLPSFAELEEKKRNLPPEDPEAVAAREQRERATSAVADWMVEAHRARLTAYETANTFSPQLEVHVDPSVALLDLRMIERNVGIAEPRTRELPDELQDDMHDCTPQALLRDLHRPELTFEKQFEITDLGEAHRYDVVADVDQAMATSWKLPALKGGTPMTEAREVLRASQLERKQPWANLQTANRRQE